MPHSARQPEWRNAITAAILCERVWTRRGGCGLGSERKKTSSPRFGQPPTDRLDLRGLARRIHPAAAWEDLILPEERMLILREIVVHTRHGLPISGEDGSDVKQTVHKGISALFAGPNGTGKSMAAEVVASDLRHVLYRVDLSQVFLDHITRTEHNLHHLFQAAEEDEAVLLFDRADGLFLSGSEVIPDETLGEKVLDGPTCHTHAVINSLLLHMESYRGLAILVASSVRALPESFMRRLSFVLSFPFPNAAQREQIWRRVFPSQAQIKGLDFPKLARLELAGGPIRDIALHAASLAAEQQEPVNMQHLRRAAKPVYRSLDRHMTAVEFHVWS